MHPFWSITLTMYNPLLDTDKSSRIELENKGVVKVSLKNQELEEPGYPLDKLTESQNEVEDPKSGVILEFNFHYIDFPSF